jgi:hypothetical protein
MLEESASSIFRVEDQPTQVEMVHDTGNEVENQKWWPNKVPFVD